jgi:hypothetical protein
MLYFVKLTVNSQVLWDPQNLFPFQICGMIATLLAGASFLYSGTTILLFSILILIL